MTKVETHINGQFWMFISSLAQLIRERERERVRDHLYSPLTHKYPWKLGRLLRMKFYK